MPGCMEYPPLIANFVLVIWCDTLKVTGVIGGKVLFDSHMIFVGRGSQS